MLKLIIFVVMAFSLTANAYVFEESGCTDDQVAKAQKELKQMEERFKEGEVTRTDVRLAQFAVNETLYCKENPNPIAVSCIGLTGLEQSILDGYVQEMRVGERTNREYGEELKKAGSLFVYCDSKP